MKRGIMALKEIEIPNDYGPTNSKIPIPNGSLRGCPEHQGRSAIPKHSHNGPPGGLFSGSTRKSKFVCSPHETCASNAKGHSAGTKNWRIF